MLFRIDGLFVVFHHRLPREKDILRTACREKQPAKLHKSEDSENARKQKTLTTGIAFSSLFPNFPFCVTRKGGKTLKKDFKYRFVFCYLSKITVIAGVFAVMLTLVVNLHRMEGNRMFPSVRDGDLGIFYRLTDCYTDDVVLYTDKTGQVTVGRIIAVGGQTVEFFKDGGYEVDGAAAYDEIPYKTYMSKKHSISYPVTLEKDEYFILNDFRNDTADSREYGPVKKENVKGKLLYLLRRRGF